MIKLPGFIQLLRAPEGQGSGGGAEPSSSGSGDSAPSTTPAPATGAPGGSPAAPSSPSGATAPPAAKQELKRSDSPTDREDGPTPLAEDAFSGFGADDGDEAATPSPKEPAAPAAAKPKEAQTPGGEAPQPSEKPPAEAAPEPQKAPTGPQEAVPQLPSPAEPARMASVLLQDIEAFSEHLASQPEFKLSEADIEAINNDVNTAIPKLMARTYVRAQASALSQMDRVVPAMIQRYLKVDEKRRESEGTFYKRWPSIQKAAHGEVVDRLARTYRKENPQAPLQQMVEDLGPLVMMVAKIAPTAAAQPNGSGGAHVAASGRRPPASPFQPAVGGSASPPASAAPPDPWSGYGAQEDE